MTTHCRLTDHQMGVHGLGQANALNLSVWALMQMSLNNRHTYLSMQIYIYVYVYVYVYVYLFSYWFLNDHKNCKEKKNKGRQWLTHLLPVILTDWECCSEMPTTTTTATETKKQKIERRKQIEATKLGLSKCGRNYRLPLAANARPAKRERGGQSE